MTWPVQQVVAPAELVPADLPDEWPRLTADEVVRHAPDVSLVVRDGARLAARCSLWWGDTPPLPGQRLGVIGHFGAREEGAARALLDEGCRRLQQAGCTMAVGPMDGNTWRRYRLVVDPMTEPAFFMEPTNPAMWPSYFADAGFTVMERYTSGLNSDLSVRDPRAGELEERFRDRRVLLRQVNRDDFANELRRIYAVAEVSFRGNVLYTPLPEAEFAEQYAAVRPLVVPELVLLAEHEGRPVGFVFCLPDLLEKRRTGVARTAIIKTLSSLPERERYGGLGSLMTDHVHRRAHDLGLTRVIHALMHETNQSRKISDRTGVTMRRYALYARELHGA